MAASSSSICADAAGAEGDRDPPRRKSGESSGRRWDLERLYIYKTSEILKLFAILSFP